MTTNTHIMPQIEKTENNRLERIWTLAYADFRKRYYHDRLGLLWALIKPLYEVGIYYVIFKMGFKIQQENFVLFLFGGLIIWMAFAEATKRGMGLLVDKLYLIENVQLKWVDLYISFTLSIFMAFAFNFSVLITASFIAGFTPGPELLYFPIVLLSLYLLTMGMVIILSCVQPFLTDLNHLWDMLLMLGLWVSGVFYPHAVLTNVFPWMYYANPFLGIVHNTRAVWIEGLAFDPVIMAWNLFYALVVFGVGLIILKPVGSLAVEKL